MSKQKNQNKKRIGSIIFYIITAFLVYFIALNIIIPDRVVNYAGFQMSVIPSGSMQPNINPGDVIILTAIDQENINEGDIVVYYNYINIGGAYRHERVVHRVVDIQDVGGELQYYTQGDNRDTNPTTDVIRDENGAIVSTYLTSDAFIAKVPQLGANHWALRLPLFGYIILVLQWLVRNPILLLLIVVNVGIIITLIVYLVKTRKKNEQEGKKEESNRMKAKDITDDSEHDRTDDEEDGSV